MSLVQEHNALTTQTKEAAMRRNNTAAAARRRSRNQAQFTAMAATASLVADLQMLRTWEAAQSDAAPLAVTV